MKRGDSITFGFILPELRNCFEELIIDLALMLVLGIKLFSFSAFIAVEMFSLLLENK